MKKEERIENDKQMKEGKINSLMAKLQTEKEEVQEKISELERKRPSFYAKVVLKQEKAKARDDLESKLSRLQDRERRIVLTVRGLKELLTELDGINVSVTYFKEDREKFEELKGLIVDAEEFRPMWDNEVRQFGPAKSGRVLAAFRSEMEALTLEPRYIRKLSTLAKELDEESSLREFIQETTGRPIESFLEG